MYKNGTATRLAAANISRRSVLRTTGGALVTGIGIAGFGGSARASHCPEPDSDDEYIACDDVTVQEEYTRPFTLTSEAQVSLSVGMKGVEYDYCEECAIYYFDLVGVHEAYYDDDGDQPDVSSFGFGWETSSTVTPDPQPLSSTNIQSGETDPEGGTSPNGDDEEAWLSLGDIIVSGGTLVYPGLGVPALLYTIARASDLGDDTDDDSYVEFDPSTKIMSGGFGYYNMRMQVPKDVCGTVEFEGFTKTPGDEITTTTRTFDLDWHTCCTCL